MAHVLVEDAEAVLDKEIPVLDHGFVRLVDYFGGDERVVQAARVSYAGGTKTARRDHTLIMYLLQNQHTSPFEQVVLTFHCKMPIFVARQWVRHRTARLNEISGRYSVLSDEFYLPQTAVIRGQSLDNKQGRSEKEVPVELQQAVLEILRKEQQSLYKSYQDLIAKDVARELARINLPLSLYTQIFWQIDLHNLFHFLRLRLHEHAQLEIRKYAEALAVLTRKVAPVSYAAFEEYMLHAVQLSRPEIEAVRAMLLGKAADLNDQALKELQKKLGLAQ